MGFLEVIGAIIMIAASVLVVILVGMQKSKGNGLSALGGGNSFLSNNTDRSLDATLAKITKMLTVVIFVCTIIVYAVAK